MLSYCTCEQFENHYYMVFNGSEDQLCCLLVERKKIFVYTEGQQNHNWHHSKRRHEKITVTNLQYDDGQNIHNTDE